MKNLSLALLGLSTVSLLLGAASANAQTSGDVNFGATVANVCVVAGTAGTMQHDTTDITKMTPLTSGIFTVTNTTPNGTVTITPPDTFTDDPVDYTGNPTFSYEYSLSGANTLAAVEVSDESASSATLALPGLTTGTLDSSVTTSGGEFTTGVYLATYTVTCS